MDRSHCPATYWSITMAMHCLGHHFLVMASTFLEVQGMTSMKQVNLRNEGRLDKILCAKYSTHCLGHQKHSALGFIIIGISLRLSEVTWPLIRAWLCSCCSLDLECPLTNIIPEVSSCDIFFFFFFALFCKALSNHPIVL